MAAPLAAAAVQVAASPQGRKFIGGSAIAALLALLLVMTMFGAASGEDAQAAPPGECDGVPASETATATPALSSVSATGLPSSSPSTQTSVGPAGTGDATWVSGMPDKVGPWGKTPIANAAQIIKAGTDLHLDPRSITIGVMVAMGESALRVLDHGDAVGPDSRGLFQQRQHGWGSYADRMTPYISATNFFKALMKVPNYRSLPPTIAANRTQKNADPNHYVPFWSDSVSIVAQLTHDPSLIAQLPQSAAAPDECATGVGGGGGEGTPATCGNPRHTAATADGTVVYSGRCWLGGSGIDIRANGGSLMGTAWQCTELVRRFWWSRGWAPRTWHGGTGRTIWNYQTPPGAESLPQGKITKLGAGDIVSIAIAGHDLGHTGVVNAIRKKGSTYEVEMMSQNTPEPIWLLTWDGSSLSTQWSGYQVAGVMHRKAA